MSENLILISKFFRLLRSSLRLILIDTFFDVSAKQVSDSKDNLLEDVDYYE